jgi:hypothetical protein
MSALKRADIQARLDQPRSQQQFVEMPILQPWHAGESQHESDQQGQRRRQKLEAAEL